MSRAAMVVLAPAQVRTVARALTETGIAAMPLKGVLLQQWVYQDPRQRPISDVDLLVRPPDFDRAVACLARAGFTVGPATASGAARVVRSPHNPVVVDLHRRLFARGVFDLAPQRVFERASPNRDLFGAEVLLPDPYDLYAHLIGNFAKARLDARHAPQLRDLSKVPARFDLEPGRAASHVHAHGLGRAARYALRCEDPPAPFSEAVLKALPSDPLGDYLALWAQQVIGRKGYQSKWGIVPAHLLNRSVPAAFVAMGWRALGKGLSNRLP